MSTATTPTPDAALRALPLFVRPHITVRITL